MVRNLILSHDDPRTKLISESLRVTPGVDVLTKQCNEPFQYTATTSDFKKLTVELTPGDVVVLPYAMTTEDPKYFENPKRFMPERMFSKDSFIKGTFHPFSDGPRGCIGTFDSRKS